MERRQFPRVPSQINTKFLVNNDKAGDGIVVDLSANGIRVETSCDVLLDDDIVFYFQDNIRIAGTIIRIFPNGFAVALSISDLKKMRLSTSIDCCEDKPITRIPIERRISERKSASYEQTICFTAEGEGPCKILDISLNGIAFETMMPLKINELVSIGQINGRIVRKDGHIYGLEFDKSTAEQSANMLNTKEREET